MKISCLKFLLVIFITSFNLFFNLLAFDRSYFYRASSFWNEPRFERNWLSTINVQLMGGITHFSRNKCYKKRALFGIYGPEKLNISNVINKKFYFTGVFDIFEVDLNVYQNLKENFFLHLHVPAVSAELFPEKIKYSSKKGSKSYVNNKFSLLNKILKKDNLFLNLVKERGLADISLFLGYTINYENTEHLDYIDCAIELGVLFPTSKKRSRHLIFSIPLGYDGHYGITWTFELALGVYDWLTFGIHNDGVGFFDIVACRPIRTIESKGGIIRFKQDKARIKTGPVYRTGAYIKADHLCWGLSLLAGFNFEQKNRTFLIPIDNNFNKKIANQDDSLKTWNRWNLNILVDYDFARYDQLLNPFVSIIYDYSITGKRIFDTSMIGGYFGLNIDWLF